MKKFNIEDYLKQNMIIINKSILMNHYNMSAWWSVRLLWQLKKDWLIIKITRWNYIFITCLQKIDRFQLAMLFDNTSYISLYNVLERNIIKQAHVKTYVLSNKTITKNKELMEKYRIEFIETKIPLTFWMEIINNVRYADTERALLDLIYLHTYTQFPITSELYLKGNINEDKIEIYLNYYPIRVTNFYYNKLENYEK